MQEFDISSANEFQFSQTAAFSKEMQAFVHQHLLSMLSPFSLHLKDLKDELDALRIEMEKKSEQLKHTNTVVKHRSSNIGTKKVSHHKPP